MIFITEHYIISVSEYFYNKNYFSNFIFEKILTFLKFGYFTLLKKYKISGIHTSRIYKEYRWVKSIHFYKKNLIKMGSLIVLQNYQLVRRSIILESTKSKKFLDFNLLVSLYYFILNKKSILGIFGKYN